MSSWMAKSETGECFGAHATTWSVTLKSTKTEELFGLGTRQPLDISWPKVSG